MLKQLAGSSLSEEDRQEVTERVMAAAGGGGGGGRLSLEEFKAALGGAELSNMVVEVPVDL